MKKRSIFLSLIIALPITLISTFYFGNTISNNIQSDNETSEYTSSEEYEISQRYSPIEDDDTETLSANDVYTNPDGYGTVTEIDSASEFYSYYGVENGTYFKLGVQDPTDASRMSRDFNWVYNSSGFCQSGNNTSFFNYSNWSATSGSTGVSASTTYSGVVVKDSSISNYIMFENSIDALYASNSDTLAVQGWNNGVWSLGWGASNVTPEQYSFKIYIDDNNTTSTQIDDAFAIKAHPDADVGEISNDLWFGIGAPSALTNCGTTGNGSNFIMGNELSTTPDGTDFYLMPSFIPTLTDFQIENVSTTHTTFSYQIYKSPTAYYGASSSETAVEYRIYETSKGPESTFWSTPALTYDATSQKYSFILPTESFTDYTIDLRIYGGEVYETINFTTTPNGTVSNLTVNADDITQTTAILNFDYVNNNSQSEDLYYRVNGGTWEYIGTYDSTQNIEFAISGLSPNSSVNVEVRVEGYIEPQANTEITFTTEATPSNISNVFVSNVTDNSAVINFTTEKNDGNAELEYRLIKDNNADGNNNSGDENVTINPSAQGWAYVGEFSTDGDYSINTSSLSYILEGNTSYIVEFQLDGILQTESVSFQTLSEPSVVENSQLVSVTDTQATISYDYTANDDTTGNVEYRVIKTSDNSTVKTWTATTQNELTGGDTTYNQTITGLNNNTTYKVEFRTNGGTPQTPANITFTTGVDSDVALTNFSTSNIGKNSAEITYSTSSSFTNGIGIEYKIYEASADPSTAVWQTAQISATQNTTYTQQLNLLDENTTYLVEFRPQGYTSNSDTVSFTTLTDGSSIEDMTIISTTSYSVTFSFDFNFVAGTTNVFEYRMSNGEWQTYNGTVNDGVNTFTVGSSTNPLEESKSYSLWIRLNGIIDPNDTIYFTTSSEVAELNFARVKSVTDNSITIEYNVNMNEGYGKVEYSLDGGESWVTIPQSQEVNDGQTYTYEITGLEQATEYVVIIRVDGIVNDFVTTETLISDIQKTIPYILIISSSILTFIILVAIIFLTYYYYTTRKHKKNLAFTNYDFTKQLVENDLLKNVKAQLVDKKGKLNYTLIVENELDEISNKILLLNENIKNSKVSNNSKKAIKHIKKLAKLELLISDLKTTKEKIDENKLTSQNFEKLQKSINKADKKYKKIEKTINKD